MPKSQTIKGLERGLQVLQFLQSNPISSLHEVHTSKNIEAEPAANPAHIGAIGVSLPTLGRRPLSRER
jgi:hypothetical protein